MFLNTTKGYGWVSIALHWLMAIAFIAMFAVGTYMVDLDYYDPWYHRLPDIHKAVGILLVMLMFFRFIWNQVQVAPERLAKDLKTDRLALIAHRLFYLLVLLLFISGYLISTAKGKGIDVFEWFSIPALLPEDSERGDLAGDIHDILSLVFIGLASVHASAALYHHFYIKDFTLKRMLRVSVHTKGDNS